MKKLLLVAGCCSLQLATFATIRYVKAGGAGTQTGASWANASGDLQLMINQSSASVADTIWVAAGTYKPNRPANNLSTIDAANRNNAFTFIKNVRLFGGFPATGNPVWAARNWQTNVTRLSGNIGAADSTDNSYHVVITAGAAITAVFIIDGFTICDANAMVASDVVVNGIAIRERFGAGWNNTGGSPTLRNMIFEHNAVSGATAFGLCIYNEGNPTISNTVFRNNKAAASRGGALYNQSGNPVLNNVLIQGNAVNAGGGGYSVAGTVTMNNVTIAGNSAFTGGGWYLQDGDIVLNNSIMYHNTASDRPGVKLQENPPIAFPTASYNYSLVQNVAGGSNLNGNTLTPAFVSPLPGTAAPTAAGDYRLSAASPCINTGSNALIPAGIPSDLDGLNRVAAATVDMGVYEFGSVPLGVDISGFAAIAEGCTVQLSWKGENETGLSHYEIEAAGNARQFTAIGRVRAQNQSSAAYRFRLSQATPLAYYRIRSVDVDGSTGYSDIVPVAARCAAASAIVMWPNPVTDVLHLNGLEAGQYLVITDVVGKTLLLQPLEGTAVSVSLQQLSPGLYHAFVRSATGQVLVSEKLVRQ